MWQESSQGFLSEEVCGEVEPLFLHPIHKEERECAKVGRSQWHHLTNIDLRDLTARQQQDTTKECQG